MDLEATIDLILAPLAEDIQLAYDVWAGRS